jgi:hypothetical protein
LKVQLSCSHLGFVIFPEATINKDMPTQPDKLTNTCQFYDTGFGISSIVYSKSKRPSGQFGILIDNQNGSWIGTVFGWQILGSPEFFNGSHKNMGYKLGHNLGHNMGKVPGILQAQ